MAISMLKIRRPLGRLIFNMGIAIPGKTVFLIETAPCLFYFVQGWGQVLSEVLESSTSTFKICKFKYKYKYSQYLDGTKYIKYFFNQVQVQVPSTLITNNSIVSLWVQNSFTTITLVHTVTYKVKNTFQICTKITFILWNQPWIDKLCMCHPTQLMDHVINHRRSWLLVIASTKIL